MDRVAVFVDAGYLFAGGSTVLSGERRRRTETRLDVSRVVEYLSNVAAELSGCQLLRIYWYDGALSSGLSTEQNQLAYSPNVKLKLGVVNSVGQQKGVDAQIVNDLAELSRRGAICDGVLVGGDGDLRLGVELAQEKGVRVHLLVFDKATISPLLRREADTLREISQQELEGFLAVQTAKASAEPEKEPTTMMPLPTVCCVHGLASEPEDQGRNVADVMRSVVASYLGDLSENDRSAFKEAVELAGEIPGEHDGRILATVGRLVGRFLDYGERKMLRALVRDHLTGVEEGEP